MSGIPIILFSSVTTLNEGKSLNSIRIDEKTQNSRLIYFFERKSPISLNMDLCLPLDLETKIIERYIEFNNYVNDIYESFDERLRQIENYENKKTEKEKKKNLKKGLKLIYKTRIYKSHKNCSICLDGMFGLNCSRLSCRHVFHENCINEWFKEKPNCPICRNQ